MRTVHTDALVVGSGFGAAAPALRLAEAGLGVTILEKGERVERHDFRLTQDPKYLLRYLRGLSTRRLSLTYAEALGGGSGFYEMVSLRAPSATFEQRDASGRPLWPEAVSRRALDPYYDIAERMLRVEQVPAEQVPRTGLVFSLLMKNLGYSCDRARYAVRNCVGSGFCVTGCVFGAKQSLHVNYLPQAVAAGAVIECGTAVEAIEALEPPGGDRRARRIGELPWRYAVTAVRGVERIRYVAKVVVLAAGTVGTARLLLASRLGLPALGRHVGRHVSFNGSVKVAGLLPDAIPDADMYTGRTHPGMVSYEFLATHGMTVAAGKALPLLATAGARLRLEGSAPDDWWGPARDDLMRQYRRRVICLLGLGYSPAAGRIRLRPDGSAALECPDAPDLRAYHDRATTLLSDILRRNGCRLLETDWLDRAGRPHPAPHFSTTHQLGSARMADRAADGVVDPAGEAFGHAGLYVCDGAALPSALAVNTSLTILANAERVAAGILDRLRLRAA